MLSLLDGGRVQSFSSILPATSALLLAGLEMQPAIRDIGLLLAR
jgi:hypothetical protein